MREPRPGPPARASTRAGARKAAKTLIATAPPKRNPARRRRPALAGRPASCAAAAVTSSAAGQSTYAERSWSIAVGNAASARTTGPMRRRRRAGARARVPRRKRRGPSRTGGTGRLFRPPASEEEPQREIRVVAAPEKRLRLQGPAGAARARTRRCRGLRAGDRRGRPTKRPGACTPAHVARSMSGGEREPAGLERRRSRSSRKPRTSPARETPDGRHPAPARKHNERRDARERRSAERPDLAEQEHERARRDEPRGEDRVEVAVAGFRARAAAGRPRRRGGPSRRGCAAAASAARRFPERTTIASATAARAESGRPGAACGVRATRGEPRPRRPARQRRAPTADAGGELVGVGAHEGQRPKEKHTAGDGDERATGARSFAL